MNTKKVDIKDYFEDIKDHFNNNANNEGELITVSQNKINSKECYYIFDFIKGEIVEHDGFEKLFGYSDKEVNKDLLLDSYHKDDIETIIRISKTIITHYLRYPDKCKDSLLQMSYRFRKKDGSYSKILSQSSIYKTNTKGLFTHIIAKLTDISFMDNYDYVNWTFHAKEVNNKSLTKDIYDGYENFVSPREKQIIFELQQGLTSSNIAKKLSISKETVATHRKNIFKKTNVSNVNDLVVFCKKNGIL